MDTKIEAVLFDLDGTLVDTLEDLAEAVNHMLDAFNRPLLPAEAVRLLIGKGAENLTRRALQSDNAHEIERGLKLLTDYNTNNIAVNSRLYPGALQLLQELAAENIKMAIVSNKNEALSRKLLGALEIDNYFTYICGGDTFPELKPSPLPLLHTCRQFGLLPEQVVMVGDSINDIKAGNLAGIRTIGCDWGFGSHGELADATYKASSCNQVGEILGSLIKQPCSET